MRRGIAPDQAARLDTVHDDLQQRVVQAQEQHWFADVDQLHVTLKHLEAKKHQVDLTLTTGRPAAALLAAAPPLTLPTPA